MRSVSLLNKKKYDPADETLIEKQGQGDHGYARPPEDPACVLDYFHELGFVEDGGRTAISEMNLMMVLPDQFFAYWRNRSEKNIHDGDPVAKLDNRVESTFDAAIKALSESSGAGVRIDDASKKALNKIHDNILQFAPRFADNANLLTTLFVDVIRNAKEEMKHSQRTYKDLRLSLQQVAWIVTIENKISRPDPYAR